MNFLITSLEKNILILPHAMSDNLFNNNWNIFHTAYHWFYETIVTYKISMMLIDYKTHPYEFKFSEYRLENF